MLNVLDMLEAIADACSTEEAWAVLTEAMAGVGFDRLLYGFTRYRSGRSFGDLQDILILSNHGEAYVNEFIYGGLYFNAPMVRWAAENVGARSWRLIGEQASAGQLSADEMRVVEFNRRYDVTAGYSIGFRDVSSRSKGALGLTARPGVTQEEVDALWENHGREIAAVANMAHLKLISLPHSGKRRTLTPRQREALEWVGDGKTTQDIATIMGLTPATVEKHLRLAREVLDVETTAQAVLKASFQNQIFLLEASG